MRWLRRQGECGPRELRFAPAFSKFDRVSQILAPACGFLVADQVFETDELDGQPIDIPGNSMRPCLLKSQA